MVGSGEQPKGGDDLTDRNAFQALCHRRRSRHRCGRGGEGRRAAIGDRDLEGAGLADRALQIARLLDVDRLRQAAALRTVLAERIDDVVARAGPPVARAQFSKRP